MRALPQLMRSLLLIALLSALLLSSPGATSARPANRIVFSGAADPAKIASFGQWQKLAVDASGAVAISADGRAVVIGDSIAEPCPGAVCRGAAVVLVSSRSQWSRAQTLAPTDRSPGFGKSAAVSADGGVVVVGAQSSADDDSVPAVYIFVRSGTSWKIAQTLTAMSPEERFGRSVAVSSDGGTIVVGDDAAPPDGEGVAHVYTRSSSAWNEIATLEGPSADFTFGKTVAVSSDGTTILALSSAAGFVFARFGKTWKLNASLVPTPGFITLTSAALSPEGRVAVLTDDDVKGNVRGPGRAYVFVRTGSRWGKAQTIIEPGARRGWNEFGVSAAAAQGGRTLILGAPLTDVGISNSFTRGVVHVFSRVGERSWRRTQTLRTRGSFDFGRSTAITPDGTRIVVGALDPAFVLSR